MMRDDQEAILVVGLGNGDEGKGAWTDYFARTKPVHTVVRFNGGAQAGHNVVVAGGRRPTHHTFAQFGSGTFVPGVRTHLSQHMLVNPERLTHEEAQLYTLGVRDALPRLTIDERALITTPLHIAMNRLREMARGDGRHGSCGMGIGETMMALLDLGQKSIRAGDLRDRDLLIERLAVLQMRMIYELEQLTPPAGSGEQKSLWATYAGLIRSDEIVGRVADIYGQFIQTARIVDPSYMEEIAQAPGVMVFEGAQGVLLDEWQGFHPYTTWSTTTFKNAEDVLSEAGYDGWVTKVGLLRAYATRHGAGPMVTERRYTNRDPRFYDPYNIQNPWQEGFRTGPFDAVMARYALEVTGGVDVVALSHLDQIKQGNGRSELFTRGYLFTPSVGDRDLVMRAAADLADFEYHADRDDYEIVRLKPSPTPHDLDYQARLTALLGHCEPYYDLVEKSDQGMIDAVESALDVRVGFIAHGPTAIDRSERKRD